MALHVRLKLQFPQVKVLVLGIFLALLGLACIVMGIVAFTKRVWGHYVATGLWGGTMVFATGTCAIIASQLRTPCSVKSYLVCSVFGIITSFVMIVLSSGGLDYNSRFYNFSYFALKKRHTATVLVHATTLVLSLLSFMGNIISLIICLKYIVYDRHQPVCETKVKRLSGRPIHKDVRRSISDSRVPLTGCHRSQRRNSRSKKNGTVCRGDSRGERRSSDGSRHSHRHRRKHEQSTPGRGSRRHSNQTSRSAIEYENITNDNLQQQQQSENRAVCANHYEEDLLPTAFDEEELPPYEPYSAETVNILPPNIPLGDDGQRQGEQVRTCWSDAVKPPVTPPNLDPEVRALFLASHELEANLDSVHKRKPSTEKSNKIVCKILKGSQSEGTCVINNSEIVPNSQDSGCQFPVSSATCTSSVSHPLNTYLLANKTVTCENEYENINTLFKKPGVAHDKDNSSVGNSRGTGIAILSPLKPSDLKLFSSPAFQLRLEPEGRQDSEEKEDIIKPFSDTGGKPVDNVQELHSDNSNVDPDIKFLPSPSSQVPRSSVDLFHVSENTGHTDPKKNDKDLNAPTLKPIKLGSPTSAFHPYDGQNSVKTTTNKPTTLSGAKDSFGGARPKYTVNILPLNLDTISPNSTCNIQTQSSWKDFLLPPPHSKDKPDQTPSSSKNDSVSSTNSINSVRGNTFKFAEPVAPAKTDTQNKPTPPVFIPPVSVKSKKTAQSNLQTSSSPSRPITSLHPRYHQPFSSDLSLFTHPNSSASTAVTSSIQPPVLSSVSVSHTPSTNRPEVMNVSPSVSIEPEIRVQARPSVVGGEASVVQADQQRQNQQQGAEGQGSASQGQRQPHGQEQPSQEGSRRPPLFSVLL